MIKDILIAEIFLKIVKHYLKKELVLVIIVIILLIFVIFFNKIEYYDDDGNRLGSCDKIYYFNEREDSNGYKETYDFWLTSLIFNCLIMVLYLCLALFGFLIFKESSGSGGSGGVVSIK